MASHSIEVRRARQEESGTLLQLIHALADYEKLAPPTADAQQRLVRDIFGDKPRLDAFFAFIAGRAVGYTLVLETYSSFLALPTLYLEDLFVLPEFRSQGAGAALFKAMAKEAHHRGCGRMEWAVLDWNQLARDFYARFEAKPLNDWIMMRLTREELQRFA
jgi:GNAT superfamily N-acetyltransferase